MILKLLPVIATLFFSCSLQAQVSDLQLKNVSRKDGLPSNESYCIYRDSKDYLWIGTDQGVVRFNGSKMEHFNLPDNVVFKIREDDKGRVWFFSHSGLLSYYYKNVITLYKYNDAIAKELKGILITDARIVDDEIFINSHEYYNYKISREGKITPFKYLDFQSGDLVINISKFNNGFFAQKEKDNCGVNELIVLHINIGDKVREYKLPFNQRSLGQYGVINREGRFYVFNSKTIICLNEDGTSSYRVMPSEILTIGFGSNNNIWVGLYQKGAVSLNADLEENPDDHILTKLSVSSVTVDYEGGTWFCTLERGAFYLQKNVIRMLSLDGLNAQAVFRMYNVNDSILLFANSKGVHRYSNGRSDLVAPINLFDAAGLFAQGHGIYVGGSTNEIRQGACGRNILLKDPYFKNAFLFESSCDFIRADDSKIAFTAGINFFKVDYSTYKNVTDIVELSTIALPRGFLFKDNRKKIWLGNINALYYLDSLGGSPKKAEVNNQLNNKGVTAMRQMCNGLYVLGIRFGGIAIVKGNSILGSIAEEQGLSSNSVKYILARNDTLWVATSKGISIIRFSSFEPLQYEITNVADDKNIYDVVIYQLITFKDKILAATGNGIYSFNPADLSQKAPALIPFYINSVSTFKTDTSGIDVISLPFKHNRVTVSFSAVAYNSFDRVCYYYRFSNVDTVWQKINTTELLLENLSPGKYDLELKCDIPHRGRYSEVQKLQINILKPWWQSGLFMIACILFALSSFYIFYFFKIRKIKNTARERFAVKAKMLELEHAAVHAQMDPHFIFNCLTSIQQLIILGEASKANQYLVKFSRLIRSGLELSSSNYVSLTNEKNYIQEYLSLEQLRFPDSFDFSVHVENTIPGGTSIPHMMIQPFIENSIRHGIRNLKSRRGNISIIFSMQDQRIACNIIDNGIGIKAAMRNQSADSGARKSFGIDLVKKRLDILNVQKEKIFFVKIEDLYDAAGLPAGTSVIIYMPYKMMQHA
jgi:ligand-binding sensor domain-containing protein